MSEPKRYDMMWDKNEDEYIFVSPSEQPRGRWVKWEDYAILKAFSDEAQAHIDKEERKSRERLDMEQEENTRIKAEVERLDTLCKQLMTQHSDISCENIMLRKNGDALTEVLLKFIEPTDGYLTYLDCRANWTAAKEGKPNA